MITVRAGSGAIGVCLLLLMVGCSREQQDWRSAETADTIDSYGQFIQRHPESELATQARARVVQLGEDRDWQHAGSADTVDAYREFLAQHPNGKWTQEARIRIENFSLGEQHGTDAGTKAGSAARGAGSAAGAAGSATHAGGAPSVATGTSSGSAGVTSPSAGAGPDASSGVRSYGLAEPGEAAMPSGSPLPRHSGRLPSVAPAIASTTLGGPGGTAPTAALDAARTTPGLSHAPSPAGGGAAKGSYGIQLGAFASEANAGAQWRTLTSRYPSELQGLQQRVVPADTASGRIYRLQANVGDEGRARSVCDQLKKRGQACVAVLPH